MSRFKVAIFTGNYNHIRDGVSLTLNRLVSFLIEQNINVLVFGPTISKPALDHAGTLFAVPSRKLPGRPEYRVTTGFPENAQQKLKEFDPDIIHIATPDILGLKALKWAGKHKKPIVASYHTNFSSYLKYYKLSLLEPLMWKYLAWFYKKCRHVYVPSTSMRDVLEMEKIETDFRIWARGIETDLFHPSKRNEAWRKEKGFLPDDIVVTFVSRLVWEKNLRLFADVINKLQSIHKHVKALIVGEGPAAAELKEIMPNTVFTGFLKGDDLATAYASSDVFFFPSDTETFGNVTLEAMASGLPCVVADAAGSKSLVDHGKNGYLASVETPGQFYRFIENLIVNEKLRKEMAEVSLDRAKNYSWDAVNSQLLGYYKEVLELKN
jgi:phosphatidylinositol alpha 1,6-mannosyltransferase